MHLVRRILTGLIAMPLVLGAVWMGGLWYFMFVLLAANLGIFEYCVINNQEHPARAFLAHLGVSLLIVVIFLEQLQLLLPLLILVTFALFVTVLLNLKPGSFQGAAVTFFGIVYLGGFFSYLILIRQLPEGIRYTYLLMAAIWSYDTIAFFVGSKWGRHKFAPQVSPGKSVEGALGGALFTFALFGAGAYYYPALVGLGPGAALLLALGVMVFGQLGDLFESALKRQMTVKDSGKLLPGHGGVLDRLDSMLMAAPFAYYFFLLLKLLEMN